MMNQFHIKLPIFPIVPILALAWALPHALLAAPSTHVQSVTNNGQTITMRLERQDLRGSNFELLAHNSSGGYDVITPVAERAYIGTVDEHPGAVSFGIMQDDGKFRGGVIFDRGHQWWTLDGSVTKAREIPHPDPYAYPAYTVEPGHGGSTTYGFDVAFDVRYNYYAETSGGSTAKTFENIEFSMAATRALYMTNAMLRPYIARVIIRTDDAKDPANGTTWYDYLNAVKAEWQNNQTDASRDTVCGVSHNSVQGAGAGVASVGTIGSSGSVSINERDLNDGNSDFHIVWRHELGHNWGMRHYEGGAPEGQTIVSGNKYGRMSGPEVEKALNQRDSKIGFLDNEGTFTAVNLPPYASIDAFTMIQVQDSSITIDVLANDHDANGHALSIASFDSTTLEGGSITQVGQQLVYTPPSTTFLGKDQFQYVVTDSTGQTATGVACISVEPDYRLRLYLPMDDDAGTTLTDASAFGNDAEFNDNNLSASSVTGKFGKAVDFDGSADYASVTGFSLSSDSITMTAWIKPAAIQNDYTGIIVDRSPDGRGIYIHGNRTLRYHWPANTTSWTWNSGLVAPADSWTFVALVVESTKATIYMNTGSGFQSASRTANHAPAFMGNPHVGQDSGPWSNRKFDGSIDEVRIYDYSMSQTELQGIFEGSQASSPIPLNGSSEVSTSSLSWTPGAAATSNQIYLGTSQSSVNNASTSDPEYQGSVATASYDASLSFNDTQYFWRVDTVTPSGTIKGDVWSFTTTTFHPPTAIAGDDQAVTIQEGTGGGNPVAGAHLEWDASQDTEGDATWPSTTATNYDWTFDGGGLSPVAATDTRFDRIAKAYVFPSAKDGGNTSWQSFGSGAAASFEFVIDVDGTDGSIFETGASKGLQVDVSNGVLRGAVGQNSGAKTTYTLTQEDMGRFIHVVFTADPGNQLIQLYVDGQLKDSKPWTDTLTWSGSNGAALGSTNGKAVAGGSSADFIGKMALFRFYQSKALTAAEVTTNFSALSNGYGAVADLEGSVSDPDGETPAATWSLESSDPAGMSVVFGNSNSPTSSALFVEPGTYVLKLTADDGIYQDEDFVTITVHTPAEAWRFLHFGDAANSGDGADDFDFDGDGMVNLFERAFGSDPTDSGNTHRPSVSFTEVSESDYLSITYRRLKGGSGTTGTDYTIGGITYCVEHDDDLVAPWANGAVTQVGNAIDNGDGTETVTVRLNQAMSAVAKCFIRLKVTTDP